MKEEEYVAKLTKLSKQLAPNGLQSLASRIDEFVSEQSLSDKVAAILWAMNTNAMIQVAEIAHMKEQIAEALDCLRDGKIDRAREACESAMGGDAVNSVYVGPIPVVVIDNA